MKPETMTEIATLFTGSKWTSDTNSKYSEAFATLQPYEDAEVVDATKALRASLARTHCTAAEIVGEIRRMRKRSTVQEKAQREYIDIHEVTVQRDEMRKAIMLAPREVVAQAVAYCRKAGAIESKPLSGDVTQWSAFTTGMVYAAIERAHG